MENLLHKLEQICQCGVCLERLHEPKQLICQHIFCQRCLMKTCTDNRMGLMSLFCPSCRERQPMIYRPFDVLRLKPPLFVNQVLEVLTENSQRHGNDGGTLNGNPQNTLINTKITSVYKTINIDTLEHMTQIRTDEFGVRDTRVQELQKEVEKSRDMNSQLLIDNFIMKARMNEKDNICCLTEPEMSDKQSREKVSEAKVKNLCSRVNENSDGKCKTEKKAYNGDKKDYGDKLHDGDKRNKLSKQNYIEEKLNNYLRRKTIKTLGKSEETVRADKKPEKEDVKVNVTKEKEFCWRCLRHGHTGIKCTESKTVLGRSICRKCNMVGHEESICTAAEIKHYVNL